MECRMLIKTISIFNELYQCYLLQRMGRIHSSVDCMQRVCMYQGLYAQCVLQSLGPSYGTGIISILKIRQLLTQGRTGKAEDLTQSFMLTPISLSLYPLIHRLHQLYWQQQVASRVFNPRLKITRKWWCLGTAVG